MNIIFSFISLIIFTELLWARNIQNYEGNINSQKNKREINEECQFINYLLDKEETFNCCKYDEIKIECSNNHIIKIFFSFDDAIKNYELPKSFGSMPYLKELEISNCEIRGNIPSDIDSLISLEKLIFSNNFLFGSIPSSIGNLSNLKELLLNDNDLDGSIPTSIGNLSNLEILYLNNNNLENNIPPEIGKLKNLQQLYLFHNNLSGSLPSEIGNLYNLNNLYVDENKFNGIIPSSIGNLSNLYEIILQNNSFVGPIPSEIGNMTKLEFISLSNNKFSGEIPTKELESLTKVYYIDLSNNPDLYGRIPNIKYKKMLYMDIECNFSGTNLCYSENDKNLQCSYPDIQYSCDTCKDKNVASVIDGVCKCNSGYSGAGYIECIDCKKKKCESYIDSSYEKFFPYQLMHILIILIAIGILQI